MGERMNPDVKKVAKNHSKTFTELPLKEQQITISIKLQTKNLTTLYNRIMTTISGEPAYFQVS